MEDLAQRLNQLRDQLAARRQAIEQTAGRNLEVPISGWWTLRHRKS